MHGLHLTSDLYSCRCDPLRLTDPGQVAELCRTAVAAADLTRVAEKFFAFPSNNGRPGGVTGAVLLAESHLALHTWPESASVALDVYVCNFTRDNSAKAERLMRDIVARFEPAREEGNRLTRGVIPGDGAGQEHLYEWLGEHSFFGFASSRRLLAEQSAHQMIEVFETPQFGKLLRLDGANMTSERDEFFYHEALVHPAASTHPAPHSALIIGGGDGGAAEELLKHPSMERVLMVELDAAVSRIARRHLGEIHRGAYDDPRLEVLNTDGEAYVRSSAESFDLVLLDLTDPDTPAGQLYQPDFFEKLRKRLAPGGVLSMHIGSPVYHPQRFVRLVNDLRQVFRCVRPYSLYVPVYGTQWGMAVASDGPDPLTLSPAHADQRIAERKIRDLNYYNGGIHGALFALPNYIRKLLA